jgi:ATP-dependent helicase Lhr and Lhr-like helicase
MGKTSAVALGPMLEALAHIAQGDKPAKRGELKLLWLTPLRALANDTAEALTAACKALGLPWTVELRTGDTSASIKQRQRDKGLPNVLITTPESLCVMLSQPDLAQEASYRSDGRPPALAGIRCVVIDEWHELLGSKRGVQTQLGLARLRKLSPSVRIWGLSATIGNLDQALEVLLGPGGKGRLVRGQGHRTYDFHTIIPTDVERFPWAGHLGIRLLKPVCDAIDSAESTLLFTNTRSQAEIWFQALLNARGDYIGRVAIHHGSLDRVIRQKVESAIRDGILKCVVCTSSLDLGVDFAPVDQVIQIGSPKGIARFLQRAGRSGHQPGRSSRIVCVPTHALELVEFAAARQAIAPDSIAKTSTPTPHPHIPRVEARTPPVLAMDVLVQHLMTLAAGGGFNADHTLAEVRSTHAFATMTDQQWGWALDFVLRGGPSLNAYSSYQRVVLDLESNLYRVASPAFSRAHRLNIGTINSDIAMIVQGSNGKVYGTIEESFIGMLQPGATFTFAGRLLSLVRVRDLTAIVRPAKARSGIVPSWQGSRMPLSSHLAAAVREHLGRADSGELRGPEMAAVAPILRVQQTWSKLPKPGTLLIETACTREGYHAFVYPLEGRLVHEGLAALAAFRIGRLQPQSFSLAASDYGFHLNSPTPIELSMQQWRDVLSPAHLAEDLLACLNAANMARRQFRDIARVAGLISQGFPGRPGSGGKRKSTRQLQASSELFFDVFSEFDPANLLLDQARREVLEQQLEFTRLQAALESLAKQHIQIVPLKQLSPFCFPLWVDSLREQISSEKWTDRVQRMLTELESLAGPSLASRP